MEAHYLSLREEAEEVGGGLDTIMSGCFERLNNNYDEFNKERTEVYLRELQELCSEGCWKYYAHIYNGICHVKGLEKDLGEQ